MVFIRSMSDFARRHALVTFLFLTFAISWLGFFAGATLLFAFGPSLAGVILVLLTYNREEQRSFWRRLIDFKRISPGWYLLIVLITPAVAAASIALDTLLGGAPPQGNILSRIGEQPLEILSLAFTSLLFGALSEELGWRGYALPVLLKRWGAMRSSLVVGVFWWAWHLPLFTVPGSSHNGWGWFTAMFWLFLLTVMSLSVLLTWTYVHNRASLLSAVVLHFCYNFSLALVYPVSDRTQWFISPLFALVVAVVVLLRPVGRTLERGASAPADAAPAALGPKAAGVAGDGNPPAAGGNPVRKIPEVGANTMSTGVSPAAESYPAAPRRRRLVWVKRGLAGFAVIVVTLGVLGVVYQAVAAGADARAFTPPGIFSEVGGRRIHMQVMGNDTGRPTVLLEAGIGSFSANWAWVQNSLSSVTRVVASDRAGLGWSDPAAEPQDAQQSARDLHAALQAAGISGPYVVAGHSYGGLVVRAFADLFPQEVVGMVLVDASHPDQWAHIPASRGGTTVALGNRVSAILGTLGILRLFNMNAPLTAGLPDQSAAELKAFLDRPGAWQTSGGVLGIWEARTRPAINQARNLGDRPLAVLSVTEQALYAEVLTKLQAELPALSSNSIHLTVEGATHESLTANREHALVVANAIRQVLEASESGGQLAAK